MTIKPEKFARLMNNYQNYYQPDLAYIHDLGFSNFAFRATAAIIEMLQKHDLRTGLVVDLGCGSGLSAQKYIQANYQVLGIDLSSSMIEIARKKVPAAEFRIGSLFKTAIPPCIAVTSVGECFNYLFDADNNLRTLTNLCDRIYQALIPGGLLIFDILEPLATRKTQGFKEGQDWTIICEKDEDEAQKKLTRRIITFRKTGDYYQRSEETHLVHLYKSSEIKAQLEQIGFQVQTQSSYGNFQLAAGHTVVIAKK